MAQVSQRFLCESLRYSSRLSTSIRLEPLHRTATSFLPTASTRRAHRQTALIAAWRAKCEGGNRLESARRAAASATVTFTLRVGKKGDSLSQDLRITSHHAESRQRSSGLSRLQPPSLARPSISRSLHTSDLGIITKSYQNVGCGPVGQGWQGLEGVPAEHSYSGHDSRELAWRQQHGQALCG